MHPSTHVVRRIVLCSSLLVALAVPGARPARASMSSAGGRALGAQALGDQALGERSVLRGSSNRAPNNPGVLSPQSHPFGASYDEWAARWWQWAYSIPASGHPLIDETGANCAAGQSGPVWFLGGVFNVSGTATRDLCTVPAGKALFFPILNVEWDNVCPPVNPPMTEDELRAQSAAYMNLAQDMSCEVDGRSINDILAYRTHGDGFAATMPAGSLFGLFCGTPAGTYSPLVNDGYYLMLAPLSAGPHTIHFSGTVGDPVNFTLDITYHLTVAPGGSSAVSAATYSSAGDPASAAAPARTTWGRLKAIYR